jgi:hypothetical protein
MVLSFSSSSGVNHPTKPIGDDGKSVGREIWKSYEEGGEIGKKCKKSILFAY